jgi:hypothetical protein
MDFENVPLIKVIHAYVIAWMHNIHDINSNCNLKIYI